MEYGDDKVLGDYEAFVRFDDSPEVVQNSELQAN